MTQSFMSLAGTYKCMYYGSKDVNGEMEQCCRVEEKKCFGVFLVE